MEGGELIFRHAECALTKRPTGRFRRSPAHCSLSYKVRSWSLGLACAWPCGSAPRLLPLESEEFRSKLLLVGEDGRKVLGEVPDLARQDFFALGIQHLSDPQPGRYERFASLDQPCARRIFDRSGAC